jgi:hypothetical protein
MQRFQTMKYITILFLLSGLTSFSKNPAFILYDDGTWEKAGGGSYGLSSSSSGNSSMGSLEVLATLKMQRGGAKPVASEDVYLLTRSFAEYMRGKGIVLNDYPQTYIETYSWAVWSMLPKFQSVGTAGRSALQELKVAEEVTDLSGKAEFLGIKPGKYYVMLRTSLGSDAGCAWCVPVIIKPGRNKINLRNENVNEDLLHEGESLRSSPSLPSPTSFAPSPSLPTLTYESERDAVLTRHRNKQITNEAAIKELKSLKVKYGK